jgi:hypothetical protein
VSDPPRRRKYADYLPPEERDRPIGPEQHSRRPRPGHGTVYVHRGRDQVWTATWVDGGDYADPDGLGGMWGSADVESADKGEVLAWARRQPSARHVLQDSLDGDEVLPAADADVVVREI